jgi:hypothetical protein
MRVYLSFAFILLGLTVGQPSTAATIAVQPGSGGIQNANYGANGTIGWGFTLASPVFVTDLGYFDGNSGLVDPHPVGIWDSVGNLLATATVPSGTAATFVSGFRFVPITPVMLSAGAFTIGGYANVTSPDPFRFEVPFITAVEGLSFGPVDLFTRADTLARPTTPADVFTQAGYFGPNFLVSTSAVVPEPGTVGITLLGIAIMMGVFSTRSNPAGARDGIIATVDYFPATSNRR